MIFRSMLAGALGLAAGLPLAAPAAADWPRYLGGDANVTSAAGAPSPPWKLVGFYRAGGASFSSPAVAGGTVFFGARDFRLGFGHFGGATVAHVVDSVGPAVVRVTSARDGRRGGQGSGVIFA